MLVPFDGAATVKGRGNIVEHVYPAAPVVWWLPRGGDRFFLPAPNVSRLLRSTSTVLIARSPPPPLPTCAACISCAVAASPSVCSHAIQPVTSQTRPCTNTQGNPGIGKMGRGFSRRRRRGRVVGIASNIFERVLILRLAAFRCTTHRPCYQHKACRAAEVFCKSYSSRPPKPTASSSDDDSRGHDEEKFLKNIIALPFFLYPDSSRHILHACRIYQRYCCVCPQLPLSKSTSCAFIIPAKSRAMDAI